MIGVPYKHPRRPTTADLAADVICATVAVVAVVGLYAAIWAVVW